jgi:hypothetical protein
MFFLLMDPTFFWRIGQHPLMVIRTLDPALLAVQGMVHMIPVWQSIVENKKFFIDLLKKGP